MNVVSETITVETRGFNDMKDLTPFVEEKLAETRLRQGIVTVFVPGSTGGVTTIEYEPGLEEDFSRLMEKIAPSKLAYDHDRRWGDGNGFSHVRASLLGPSLTVPFDDGRLQLGTWQQIVFVDFDNRPRKRRIIVQILGE